MPYNMPLHYMDLPVSLFWFLHLHWLFSISLLLEFLVNPFLVSVQVVVALADFISIIKTHQDLLHDDQTHLELLYVPVAVDFDLKL
jgi:hypothetical protein